MKKVQCLLHEFVKFYITFFLFYVFLKIVINVCFFSQDFMFTVLSFLILNKLNFEYFYEYLSFQNLNIKICDDL